MTMFRMAVSNPFMIMVVRQSSGTMESVDNFRILEIYWSTDSVYCWVMSTNPRLNGTWGLKRARMADLSSLKDFIPQVPVGSTSPWLCLLIKRRNKYGQHPGAHS